ncbi:MAG: DUF4157 domain-containing protein [Okeania sp. SIO1H6]|nr:DUF4157 domain-containing protein [Okeania sp. SIO1H6]
MSGVVQTKLTVGRPNDRYEQEADRVATRVVQQINRPASFLKAPREVVQRKENEAARLRMKPMVDRGKAIGGGETSTELSGEINRARGGGRPLDAGSQQSMGQAMGTDFSGVRVHTDERADRLNRSLSARAFTTGQDIFFRQGTYQPGSKEGQRLIAHELTHVGHQNGNLQVIQRDETPLSSKVKGSKQKEKQSVESRFQTQKEEKEKLVGAEIAAKKIVEASSEAFKQAYDLLMKAGFFSSSKTQQDTPDSRSRESSREFYAGAQLKGKVSEEVKDVIAGIKLLAESSIQAGIGGSYAQKLSWNAGKYKRQLEAKLESFAGFKGSAKGELKLNVLDGLVLSASAEATLGVTSTLSGAAQVSKRNVGARFEGEVTGFAGGEAKTSASLQTNAGIVAASAKAEAFAGAKVTGKTSGGIISRRGDKLVYISLSGSASAGVGAKAEGKLGYEKGKVNIGAGIGGTVGVGAGGTIGIEINISEIKNTLKTAYSSPSVDKLMKNVAEKRPNIPEGEMAEMKKELYDAFYQRFYNYAYKKAQSAKAKHYVKREEVQKIIAEQVQSNDKLAELIWCKESDDQLAKIAYESTAQAANDAGYPELKAKSQASFTIRRGVIIIWPYKG